MIRQVVNWKLFLDEYIPKSWSGVTMPQCFKFEMEEGSKHVSVKSKPLMADNGKIDPTVWQPHPRGFQIFKELPDLSKLTWMPRKQIQTEQAKLNVSMLNDAMTREEKVQWRDLIEHWEHLNDSVCDDCKRYRQQQFENRSSKHHMKAEKTKKRKLRESAKKQLDEHLRTDTTHGFVSKSDVALMWMHVCDLDDDDESDDDMPLRNGSDGVAHSEMDNEAHFYQDDGVTDADGNESTQGNVVIMRERDRPEGT